MSNSEFPEDERQPIILNEYEKKVRIDFVREYFKDYDAYKACIRIGYAPAFAKQFAVRFMEEPFTLQLITAGQAGEDDEIDEEKQKRMVLKALWREANNFTHGSSQSARVAALSKISAFFGMDAPTRSQQQISVDDTSGVFVVPGMMTADEWAKQAEEQQANLVKPLLPPQLKAVS